jgi:hypothetical protein
MLLAAAGGCATVPFEGLYCPVGKPPTYPSSCRYLVQRKDGVLVATQHGARLARRGQLALRAPKDAGGPWQLEDGQTFTQVIDPFFALAMSKLKGRHAFVKVYGGWQFDEEPLIVGREALIIEDGLFIHIDGFREHGYEYPCHAGILVDDPTMSGYLVVPMTVAPPPAGERDSRYALLAEPPRNGAGCPEALAPASGEVPYAWTDDVRFFLGPGGEVEGLQVGNVGLYVPRGTSEPALQRLVEYWHLDDRPPDG